MPSSSNNEVYQNFSAFLYFPNDDQKLWWHSTAPMFAQMLQSSEYDVHSQYRHLGIFQKVVIPTPGTYPVGNRPRWMSILTRYGTPFELSLNCSDSVVRYTYEPISKSTGTPLDPFNTHAIWEALAHFLPLQKGINLEWFSHFKNALTLSAEESDFLAQNNLVGDQIKTQNKLALDLKGDRFVLKTYMYPALKSFVSNKSIHDLIFESTRKLALTYSGISAPLSVLEEYLLSRGPSSTATPRLLSCDLVEPSKSRVKIYLMEQMVSLASLEDIWTIGGRRTDPSTLQGLAILRELWYLIQLPTKLCSYPAGYLSLDDPVDEQLPLIANFTLHQNDPVPEPQVYFYTFGRNDEALTNALTVFFARRGWRKMAQSYKPDLHSF